MTFSVLWLESIIFTFFCSLSTILPGTLELNFDDSSSCLNLCSYEGDKNSSTLNFPEPIDSFLIISGLFFGSLLPKLFEAAEIELGNRKVLFKLLSCGSKLVNPGTETFLLASTLESKFSMKEIYGISTSSSLTHFLQIHKLFSNRK